MIISLVIGKVIEARGVHSTPPARHCLRLAQVACKNNIQVHIAVYTVHLYQVVYKLLQQSALYITI